jgi:eukaryotic-like serine/threonine-protein kinase
VNTTLPQSGEVFDFRYRIVCRLGFGGDGYVFGATELETGKRVAIKCWNGPHADTALAAAQHFVRSAHAARLFDNPNIVEMFSAEAGRTVNYCVMDWLEGMTLARRIVRQRPSPLSDVFNIVVPCMRAVAEAHAAGVVHGDVRPGHIFVCHATKHRLAIARIFDFGRGLASLPSVPNVALAPNAEVYHYATPEQLQGGELDARSDIYAFGIMLFEMLAGERPFVAESSSELALKIIAGTPKLLASISPSIPVRLAHVVERAMSVEPEQRFANLGEMIDAIEQFNPVQPMASQAYVALPRSAAVTTSTALAIRDDRVRAMPPPAPAPRRAVHSASARAEITDITTTSASWELTEPIAVSRMHELLGRRIPYYSELARVPWQRASVWAFVVVLAAFTARLVQQMAAEPAAQLPAATSPSAPPPAALPVLPSGFELPTCRDALGTPDPSCTQQFAPMPVPEEVEPAPQAKPGKGSKRAALSHPDSPRSRIGSPSLADGGITNPASPRAAGSAAAPTRSSSTRRRTGSAKPATKRSRNSDSSSSTDPFERLNDMRLQ